MLIIVNDTIYLQKYEVAFILENVKDVPKSFLQETFANDDIFTMSGPTDAFRFEYAYKKLQCIKWMLSQEWLLDYNAYNNLSLPTLKEYQHHLEQERTAVIDKFDLHTTAYQTEYLHEMKSQVRKLDHQIFSIKSLIRFRLDDKDIIFTFPAHHNHGRHNLLTQIFNHGAQ